MKLLTEELKKRFKEVGQQTEEKDPLVIAKFFDPMGTAQWYATAYDSEDNKCFGYVTDLVADADGLYDEWGYFSIDELEAIVRPFGLGIERDILFTEKRISEYVPKLKGEQ